jgi:formylglycine-generating enzyme required for sulfatase activity
MKSFAIAVIAGLLLCITSGRVIADTFGAGINQFSFDFVTIGNPGNPADTTGAPNPAGSVPYAYRMGKYEISRKMIENANAEGGLGITMHAMDFVVGGTRPAMPATGISWNEAARFTNWLNTSQGFPAAYKFSEQPGDPGYNAGSDIELWEPGDAGYDANNLFRNSRARYFLPSAHEWYKAAYYDPNANGGAGGYWDFATGSDAEPVPIASGTELGSSVWSQAFEQGPSDITQAGGLSPYGTMAQGGNVFEWDETASGPTNLRAIRGGSWLYDFSDYMSALERYSDLNVTSPTSSADHWGFRVASSIPEPGTWLLGLLSAGGLLGALLLKKRSQAAVLEGIE